MRMEPLEVRRETMVIHVNFNKTSVLLGAFEATDPITKRKRTTRRRKRSDVFYRDSRLLDDDIWVG